MGKRIMSTLGVLLLGCAPLWLSACGRWGRDGTALGADSDSSPEDPLPGDPASCNGVCVGTPPATFTGPSLFWIGHPEVAQGCPDETPDKGIEGYVAGQVPLIFARECRVTPSDLCAEEGQTCAPYPRPEFHLCIHRLGTTHCPPDYEEHTDLSETTTETAVTLCCQKSPVSS